jgi:tryptophan-rich sensory protein
MDKNKILKLIVAVFICEIAGVIGSVFTVASIPAWYATINKPWFTPPNWLFGPVWTTLFLLMGISLYFIWDKGFSDKKSRLAIYVFAIQLALNVIWSILFFGLQNPFIAFTEIIVLWIAILANIVVFYRISKKAGILLVPYIVWVTIAALLNYSVWILNV